MVKILQLAFIINLFIFFRIIIIKYIGKKIRDDFSVNQNNLVSNVITKQRIINIIMFLITFLLALFCGHGAVAAIVIAGITISIVYVVKLIRRNLRKKQILCDLLNISECMRVQLSALIPLQSVLRTLPELCDNKEFASQLTNMYLEYELSKYVLFDENCAFLRNFNYPEIRIFLSAINQQIQGTSAIEALDNLILILKEKYIDFLEENTKSKMAFMTFGVFIIVINIATMGIYPVAIEAVNAINVMLN